MAISGPKRNASINAFETTTGGEQAMEFVPQHISVAPIEFWLDLPGTPSWRSFGHTDGRTCFLIDGGLALVRRRGLTNSGE